MRGIVIVIASATVFMAAVVAGLGTPTRVSAAAPDKVAWWNFAYQSPAPQPPATTTNPDDLFVEGRQGNAPITPVSPPTVFPGDDGNKGAAQAIAAVSFTIPPGEAPDTVTLLFASGSESANCQYDPSTTNPLGSSCISLLACKTTGPFKAEYNGPWQDVPPYDCTVPSVGALSADTKGVTFGQLGPLVQGSTLSFVIVPAFYDYEDFLKPGPNALTFRQSSNPSFDLSSGFPADNSSSTYSVPGSSTFVPGSAVPGSAAAVPTAGPGVAPSATAAGRRSATTAPVVAALPAALDDTLARIVAATCLGLILLCLALLAVDRTTLRRLLGMRAATAPDPPAGGTGARGVGRFVKPRSGKAEWV